MNTAARKILMALVAVLASTFSVVAGPTASAEALTLSEIRSMDPQTYEQKVQYWINRERARRGRVKLGGHACTDKYAERWSSHLASTMSFYHQSLSPFFNDCGARYAGETLAKGAVSPRTIVRLWMNSDSHRRVMLSTSPRRVGVAAVLDSRGNWVVTADYTRF